MSFYSKEKNNSLFDIVIVGAGPTGIAFACGFADTKIKNFSSGMKLRLAFSTAISIDPDILLLDEVFAVGDIAFQKKCYETIMSFKKRGKAIIFVSHDMHPIKNFCDRVMFLKDGKVGNIGAPEESINAYIDYLGKLK